MSLPPQFFLALPKLFSEGRLRQRGGRRVNATPARGFGTFTARLDAHGRPVHVVVPLTPRRPPPSAPEPRAFPSTGFLALNDCQKISKSFPRSTIS